MSGVVALLLSLFSFYLPSYISVLTVLSGLIAVMSKRWLILSMATLSVNYITILGLFDLHLVHDWLVSDVIVSEPLLFSLLFFLQTACLAFLIWKWAFPAQADDCEYGCL